MIDLKIKVCGLKYEDNIRKLAETKPDFMGFIFYPKSKRFVSESIDKNIFKILPAKIKKVGVFVNSGLDEVKFKKEKYKLDFVQLHGNETPEFCKKLSNKNISVIKAFGVSGEKDFEQVKNYQNYCTYFLFDAKTEDFGGSGKKFDWKLLDKYNSPLPFFLSGGLDMKDIEKIKKIKNSKFFGIDINSKFEINYGTKDIEKVKSFINKIKNK
ncbi:MAG: phosphoribosylanthranilate isomerase [Bacteroidales bacterium]|nr:phosphoribosylanthranilate isomerase [Bacteroidales bacterium]